MHKKQLFPILIPGTDIVVEAGSDGYFIHDREKSIIQILYEDNQNKPLGNVLVPEHIHILWNSLKMIYEEFEGSIPFYDDETRSDYMKIFYSHEIMPDGTKPDDLKNTLQQLYHEMRYSFLFMNTLVVVDDDIDIVQNMDKNILPASILSVRAYANKQVQIDPEYGMSLKAFQEADGHLSADESYLFRGIYVPSNGIYAVRWKLGNCEVDGPSNTYDLIPFDQRDGPGVIRGRKLIKKEDYQK